MNAQEYLKGPGAAVGQKAPWDRCARCGQQFKTDDVEERSFDPKGVVCKGCSTPRPATKENAPD